MLCLVGQIWLYLWLNRMSQMAFCSELGKIKRQLVWIQNGKNILSMQYRTSVALFCGIDWCVGKYTLA